jgi:peptidoglycan/xylan/chitin deacetylase (PgdA/CDA1 family)
MTQGESVGDPDERSGEDRAKGSDPVQRTPFECRPERPLVSFTFDDFAASACRTVGPILAGRGVRGTFYACLGLLDSEFDGIQLATAEDLQAVAAAGHEIGGHTHSHVCLQHASVRTIEGEFARNRDALHQLLPGQSLRTWPVPTVRLVSSARG